MVWFLAWLGFWFSEFWAFGAGCVWVCGFPPGLRLLWVAVMHVSAGFGGFPFGLGLPRSGFLLMDFVVVGVGFACCGLVSCDFLSGVGLV